MKHPKKYIKLTNLETFIFMAKVKNFKIFKRIIMIKLIKAIWKIKFKSDGIFKFFQEKLPKFHKK